MINIKKIADDADLIVNGYAFTKTDIGIKVINLNDTKNAALFDKDGMIVETTMDDIESIIASRYLKENIQFIES